MSHSCDYCGLPVCSSWRAPATAGPLYCCYGCRFAAEVTREKGETGAAVWTLTKLGLAVFFSLNVVCFTMALWTDAVYGERNVAEGNLVARPVEDQSATGTIAEPTSLPATSPPGAASNESLGRTLAEWHDVTTAGRSDRLAASYFDLLRYLGLLFSLPVLLLLGGPLLSNAIDDLRRGRLSTDLLLLTGVAAAFGFSVISVWRGHGDVYFEVACVILVTVTLGRWLEATSRLKATQALDELERLLPDRVRLIVPVGESHLDSHPELCRRDEHFESREDSGSPASPRDSEGAFESPAEMSVGKQSSCGREISIPLAELVPPAVVRVIAGERFPADGRLMSDAVSVDEQVLTGESWSATKRRGDLVLGGTLNLDGDVLMEVSAAPSQTAVARLIAAVRKARQSQGPYQRLSDRVSAVFFPIIASIAILAFAVHWWLSSFDHGLMSGLAVVLIACPCALGLATPLAVWTAIGTAARRGVLFRNGEALERLAEVEELCLDKTGTLTTGHARVQRVIADDDVSESELLEVAQSMAESSTHAFSQAIVAVGSARRCGLRGRASGERQIIPGLGIRTETAALGNQRLMDREGFAASSALRQQIEAATADGQPITLVGWSGRVRGAFVFEESLRPAVHDLFAWCRGHKLPVTVLTGDHRRRGDRLAKELSVFVLAELLPVKKAEIVQCRQAAARVAMVGDGVNDAAALTAAHIGISLGAGTDVSRDAAAVCLLNNDLAGLPWAIELSRHTVAVIRRNLAWAFGYNAAGVVVAALGLLNPAIAALLMVVSSFLVVKSSRSVVRQPASGHARSDRGTDADVQKPPSTDSAVRSLGAHLVGPDVPNVRSQELVARETTVVSDPT